MVTPSSKPPTRLGRYELLARLATGGMGEIFLARLEGAEGFEKLYVIKRVLPHLADDQRFRAMLIAEARIAAKMSHPNICQVYELGEDDGQLYIAMEYLDGVTLLPVVRAASKAKEPLAIGMVASVLQQALDGLHYAHELRDRDGSAMGIVHRDVTPSNLFVTETGVVKVLDFGIAKVKDSSSNTQTGTVKGKYAYMAPEQLKSGSLDSRVDVFALGVVAFEMLALRRLFQRKTDYLTFRAVMELPIPSLREFRPDAPPALAEVIGRALERDPRNRYANARQFSSALHDALAGHARPWSTAEVSDYIRANFANDLQRRDSSVAAVVGKPGGGVAGVGRSTMPVLQSIGAELLAAEARAGSQPGAGGGAGDDDDDDQDFPSVDTGLHFDKPDTRDTPAPFRNGDADTPITELSPAPRGGGNQRKSSQRERATGSEPVIDATPAPRRRGWLWPLLALGIVGAAGGGMLVMYKAMQRGDNGGGGTIVIESNSGGVVTMGATDANPGPTADATQVASVDAAPAGGKADARTRPSGSGTTEPPTRDMSPQEVMNQVRGKLRPQLGALGACIDDKSAALIKPGDDGKRRIVVRFAVNAGASPRVESVGPAGLGADVLTCVRRGIVPIEFGTFPTAVQFDQPIVVSSGPS